jgi:hypothetical protein
MQQLHQLQNACFSILVGLDHPINFVPHFIADLIIEFLALVGVEHCLTLAYSKEENAIVERVIKEINRHLRALTYENTSLANYKESLPFVQRILNANYSDRLKISSSQLLFGNMLKLDRGIFLPKEEQTSPVKPLSQYAVGNSRIGTRGKRDGWKANSA